MSAPIQPGLCVEFATFRAVLDADGASIVSGSQMNLIQRCARSSTGPPSPGRSTPMTLGRHKNQEPRTSTPDHKDQRPDLDRGVGVFCAVRYKLPMDSVPGIAFQSLHVHVSMVLLPVVVQSTGMQYHQATSNCCNSDQSTSETVIQHAGLHMQKDQ